MLHEYRLGNSKNPSASTLSCAVSWKHVRTASNKAQTCMAMQDRDKKGLMCGGCWMAQQ